jgi:integrase
MPRARLRPDQVATAIKASVGNPKFKKIADGNSLYLMTRNGRGYWSFQFKDGNALRSKLLGSAADVSPNQARRAREEFVVERRNGNAGERRGIANRMGHAAPEKYADEVAKLFGEVVTEYLADKAPGWLGGIQGKQATDYRSSLIGHNFTKMIDSAVIKVALASAAPGSSPVTDFAKLPVAEIDTAAVLAALAQRKNSAVTYEKVRMRIGKILDFAKYRARAAGLSVDGWWRTGGNPARLDGHLEHEPSRPEIPEAENYAAMPAAELPAFMRELRDIGTNESKALMWTILTAARTAETIGGKRSEIHGDMWIIPKERMKGKKGKQRPHYVPLVPQALALLGSKGAPGDFLFPGKVKAKMWHSSMLDLLKELRPGAGLTVHGFRSTFRDWVSDETDHESTLAEIALAHRIGDKTEQAYARSDKVKKRRKMMLDWAAFATAA